MLTIVERTGAQDAFVFTFVSPALTHDTNSIYDLDLASHAVMKGYRGDVYGAAYNGMHCGV